MGFFKRLFGGKTPAERLAEAERLLAAGEPGLARFELEAAAAAEDAPPDVRGAAREKLAQVQRELAEARLEEARALAEAGDASTARDMLAAARGLGATGGAIAEVDRLIGESSRAAERRDLESARRRARVEAEAAELEGGVEPEHDGFAGEADGFAPEGDDQLSPLEQALLPFPEPEAARLRALVAIDARLGDALGAAGESRWAEAARLYGVLREPARSDPLVLREAGRAHLADRRPGEALYALDAARAVQPDDVEMLELMMEAHLAKGATAEAAALAREVLGHGVPRDYAALIGVLVEAGQGEEALHQIDKALDRSRKSRQLWELRGALCERMGSRAGVLEADAHVIEAWSAECQSCGSEVAAFPLASARRLAEARAGATATRAEREELAEVVRLLASHDREKAAHWKGLLAELGS